MLSLRVFEKYFCGALAVINLLRISWCQVKHKNQVFCKSLSTSFPHVLQDAFAVFQPCEHLGSGDCICSARQICTAQPWVTFLGVQKLPVCYYEQCTMYATPGSIREKKELWWETGGTFWHPKMHFSWQFTGQRTAKGLCCLMNQ